MLLAIDDWQWLDAATRGRAGLRAAAARARRREGDRDRAQRRGRRGARRAGPEPAGGARARARRRAARRRGARRPRPRAHRRVAAAAGAGAPARGVRGQPADGAGADPRARRRDGDRRAAAARAAASPRCRRKSRALLRVRRRAGGADRSATSATRPGLEEALAADVLVRDGRRLRFTPPADRGGGRGAHAAGGVARDPRPARRARRAGEEQRARHLAAAAEGPDEARGRGARAAAAEAREPRRDDRGRRAGRARRRADTGRRRPAPASTGCSRRRRRDDVGGRSARPRLRRRGARADAGRPRSARTRCSSSPVWSPTTARCALVEAALDDAGDDDALRAEIHLSGRGVRGDGRATSPTALRHAEAAVARCRGRRRTPCCSRRR